MNLLYSEKMSHSLLAQKREKFVDFLKREDILISNGLLTAIRGSQIITLMFIYEYFRYHGRVKH